MPVIWSLRCLFSMIEEIALLCALWGPNCWVVGFLWLNIKLLHSLSTAIFLFIQCSYWGWDVKTGISLWCLNYLHDNQPVVLVMFHQDFCPHSNFLPCQPFCCYSKQVMPFHPMFASYFFSICNFLCFFNDLIGKVNIFI